MSNWVCSSALGLFHILNKKSCLNSPPPTSWGSHAQKSASVGGPLCGARKHHNILRSQHQNATNERPEILSETECQRWQTHRRQVRLQLSITGKYNLTLSSVLFFFYLNTLPSPIHTSSTQTICLSSHIRSLLHTSLLFCFFSLFVSISHFLPRLPPLVCFLSPLLATVYCRGSYDFSPCRAMCLL